MYYYFNSRIVCFQTLGLSMLLLSIQLHRIPVSLPEITIFDFSHKKLSANTPGNADKGHSCNKNDEQNSEQENQSFGTRQSG